MADGDGLAPANGDVLTKLFMPKIERPLSIIDNSLRDGEQAPGVSYTVEEKLQIARLLDAVGVHGMSVGFPAVSEQERECVRQILGAGLSIERMTALSRLKRRDVDSVAELGLKWISLFVATSDTHLTDKLRMTEAEALAGMEEVVPYAVSQGLNVMFGFEDSTRTPLPRLLRFIQAAEDFGAKVVVVADTVGILTPLTTYRLFSLLRPFVRGGLGCHLHNDFGMATANALAAIEGGVDYADCTVLGLGERAGNTRLEELAAVLRVKHGLDLGLDLSVLPELTETVARAAGVSIEANKPVVGSHVFSHESGIHVHGILANPACYEPFPPALVGREHQIIYGKHSGLASIQELLRRRGLELSTDTQRELLGRIKAEAQQKRKIPESLVVSMAEALATEASAGE